MQRANLITVSLGNIIGSCKASLLVYEFTTACLAYRNTLKIIPWMDREILLDLERLNQLPKAALQLHGAGGKETQLPAGSGAAHGPSGASLPPWDIGKCSLEGALRDAWFSSSAGVAVFTGALIYAIHAEEILAKHPRGGSFGYCFALAWVAFPLALVSGIIYIHLRKRE